MKKFLLPVVAFAFLAIPARPSMARDEQLLNAKGKLTLLRVHDVGSSYGPPTDRIDVEVVIWLDSKPGYAFGFQLRNDEQGTPTKECWTCFAMRSTTTGR